MFVCLKMSWLLSDYQADALFVKRMASPCIWLLEKVATAPTNFMLVSGPNTALQ